MFAAQRAIVYAIIIIIIVRAYDKKRPGRAVRGDASICGRRRRHRRRSRGHRRHCSFHLMAAAIAISTNSMTNALYPSLCRCCGAVAIAAAIAFEHRPVFANSGRHSAAGCPQTVCHE